MVVSKQPSAVSQLALLVVWVPLVMGGGQETYPAVVITKGGSMVTGAAAIVFGVTSIVAHCMLKLLSHTVCGLSTKAGVTLCGSVCRHECPADSGCTWLGLGSIMCCFARQHERFWSGCESPSPFAGHSWTTDVDAPVSVAVCPAEWDGTFSGTRVLGKWQVGCA